MNVRPIQEAFKKGADAADVLFEPPPARLPWTNDTHREPSLRTVEKVPLTFSLLRSRDVVLSVVDGKGKEIKAWNIAGKKGLNQVRWDLITRTADSAEPYFTRYREFARAGEYELKLAGDGLDLRRRLTIASRTSPPD
jgi:hypothetical protein